MHLKCPICGRLVQLPDPARGIAGGADFPFCSDRCKLIDLGRWLDEKYQVPVSDPEPEDLDRSADSET